MHRLPLLLLIGLSAFPASAEPTSLRAILELIPRCAPTAEGRAAGKEMAQIAVERISNDPARFRSSDGLLTSTELRMITQALDTCTERMQQE